MFWLAAENKPRQLGARSSIDDDECYPSETWRPFAAS